MKPSDVSVDDMKMMAQTINMVHAAEFKISGKDACATADAIRWLQKIATDMGRAFQEARVSEASKEAAPSPLPPSQPASGFAEGVSIKAMSPGKPGKK